MSRFDRQVRRGSGPGKTGSPDPVFPTVGLALIAKDEAESLPRLLGSVVGAFDKIALVDTGSTDRTVEIFEEWARREDLQHVVERFEWCDDFGAARNFADSLLDTDWVAWADCDDEIVGARRLRKIAADSPDHVAAWAADYQYDWFEGECVHTSPRERLIRRGAGRWVGRVHEWALVDGEGESIPPERVRWVHHRRPSARSELHYRILRRWVHEEPDNPLALFWMAREEFALNHFDLAAELWSRFVTLDEAVLAGQPAWAARIWVEQRLFAQLSLAAALSRSPHLADDAVRVAGLAAEEWADPEARSYLDGALHRAVVPAVQT